MTHDTAPKAPGAIGARAEECAAAFLRAAGFRVLAMNVRTKGGELDIVADECGVLVFVEVRYRATERHGDAVETVDLRKQRRVAQAARAYLAQARRPERACRFDVVTVSPESVTHYRDAFWES